MDEEIMRKDFGITSKVQDGLGSDGFPSWSINTVFFLKAC